jgi:DNA polymerase-3 subunit delta
MAKGSPKLGLHAQTASYEAVLKELRSGKVRPWYCFTGPELFFLDRLQAAFEKLIPEEVRDFNMDIFYGREARLDRVIAAAKNYPMMAERRLVIVRDFLQLGAKGGGGDEADDDGGSDGSTLNDLIPYLQKPNPTCVLVLIDAGGAVPGNKKIGKELKESSLGYYQHFETQLTEGLPEWVQNWTASEGKREITPDAAQLLVQMVGDSLNDLSTELDKLFTFVDTSLSITVDDVKKIAGETRRFSAEDLKNALIQRDAARALNITEQLLHQSDNVMGTVIRTLAFLNSVFMNLWQVRYQMDRRISDQEIAETLGINPGYLRFQMADARRFQSARQLQQMLEYLLDAEAAVKGFSRMEPEKTFLMLIAKLTKT